MLKGPSGLLVFAPISLEGHNPQSWVDTQERHPMGQPKALPSQDLTVMPQSPASTQQAS